MVLSLVVGVGSASALTASELLNLLIAAGVIAPDKVAAATAAMSATTVTVTSGYNYTRDLTMGSTGADVTALQNYLISGGYMASGYPFGYFGAVTKTALGKFQLANGISPTAGYFGAITRAKIAALGTSSTTTTTTTTTTSGTDLAVRLAASSPMASAIVVGQAAADLAEFTFTNNTATPAIVTNVSLARLGVSSDTTLSNVYLYNGAMRLTDAASVSSGKITFNAGTGLFTVPAGSSITIAVKADIAASTSGQQVAVALTGVTSNVTLNASLPISGASMNIFAASDIAGVTIGSVVTPATGNVQAGTLNSTIWSAQITDSIRAINLKSVAFKVIGSIPSGALQNIKLYVSGIQVATANGVDANGMITFDLSAAPYRIDSNRTLEVRADVVNGSGRQFSVSLQNVADLAVIDTSYNVGVAATTGIPAVTGTITISNGSVSATLDSTLGSQNVVAGSTNVPLARYTLKAYGEDQKISYLGAAVTTATTAYNMDNVAIYANGMQVGSTQSVTNGVAKSFSLGSALIIPAGTSVTIEIRGDLKAASTNFATGTTVIASLSYGTANNAQGSYSSTLANVPSSAITGPRMTVSGVGVTVAVNAAVANYSTVANTSAQKIGSFVIQTTSAEAAKITQLTVALSGTLPATTSMSNLYLAVAGQNSTTPISPATSNNFSTNFTIPANSSTVVDVYADIGALYGTTPITNTNASAQTLTSATTTIGIAGSGTGAYATGTVTIATSSAAGLWSSVGQVYTVTINGFASNYTVAAPVGVSTSTAIATGLIDAININSNVNGIVTASNLPGTTTVVLITAKSTGTTPNAYGLATSQSASTTVNNATLVGGLKAAVKQVVTITPANVEAGDTFTVIVGGLSTTYTATAATVANVTAGLTAALNASTSVIALATTTDTGTAITLTAGSAAVDTPAITVSAANGTHAGTTGVSNTAITTLTATGYGVNSNATVSSIATGQTVTVGAGTVTGPVLTTATPDSQYVVGGTSSVIAYYNFIATYSSATIEELYFSATGTSVDVTGDNAITSITAGGVTSPIVSGAVSITGLNINIPTGYAGYNLPVTVAFNTVGIGGVTSDKTIGLVLNGFKYKSGNTEYTVGAVGFNSASVAMPSNMMDIVGSKPTVAIANPSTVTAGAGGSNKEVARVTVSADAKGDIKVNAIPLSMITSGNSTASSTTVWVNNSQITTVTNNFPARDIASTTATAATGTVMFAGAGYNIPAGTSVTFSIRSTIALENDSTQNGNLRTTLGSKSLFLWSDVNGNIASTTGAYIFNYPTDTAVISAY